MSRGVIYLVGLCFLLYAAPAPAATSLQEERRIAREALSEVMDKMPLVDDADSVDYLRAVGRRLAEHLRDDPFSYNFWLVDVASLNAFALPCGYIFFFTGLFTALESEDELAGILAHEISHAHLRHVIKRMDKSALSQGLSLAGVLAGALLGALGGGALAGALAMGSVAGGVQSQIAFTREFEEEADYHGFLLMTGSGYSGQGMVSGFGRLWQQERISGGGNVPQYLRTHPASALRMERMEAMLQRRGPAAPKSAGSEFQRVKTRLIALYQNENDAFDLFRARLRQNARDYLAAYGLALVELRRGNYPQAQEVIDDLYRWWPEGKIFVDKLQAGVLAAGGDFAGALKLFRQVTAARPQDREALTGLANCQLQLNLLAEAHDNYVQVLRLAPQDHESRYNLGLALGRLGRAHEASAQLGLAFFQRKNLSGARYHLERASQNLPAGSELKAQVDSARERMEDKELGAEQQQIRQEERIQRERERRWQQAPPPPWQGES
jgi:predicted Zn-dependent protease